MLHAAAAALSEHGMRISVNFSSRLQATPLRRA
jgi:hypothetical protein